MTEVFGFSCNCFRKKFTFMPILVSLAVHQHPLDALCMRVCVCGRLTWAPFCICKKYFLPFFRFLSKRKKERKKTLHKNMAEDSGDQFLHVVRMYLLPCYCWILEYFECIVNVHQGAPSETVSTWIVLCVDCSQSVRSSGVCLPSQGHLKSMPAERASVMGSIKCTNSRRKNHETQ